MPGAADINSRNGSRTVSTERAVSRAPWLGRKKGGDSFCKTAKSRREDDLGGVDVSVMDRSACAASPHSHSNDLRYLKGDAP